MKNLGLGLVSTALVGCASIIGQNVNTNVSFAGGGSRAFTFKKNVGAAAVTKDQIYSALIDAFRSASLVKPVHTYTDSSGKRTRGARIDKTPDGNIQVDHLDNLEPLIESRKATYVLEISESADLYEVKMNCPKSYHDIGTLRGGALPSAEPYITAEQAMHNFVTICEKSAPAIQSVEYVKGEIDSKFGSESVFANFSRILRLRSDYRGGAKALYSIKYPYTVRADGTTSYDPAVIAQAQKRIEAVAND
jgi:hypothetical protein